MKINHIIKSNLLSFYFILVIILIWNYFMISSAFSYAVTHDEITFYWVAIFNFYNGDFTELLFQKNSYGYGSIWYSLYTFMIYISSLITNINYFSLINFDSTIVGAEIKDIYYILPLIFMKLINIISINMVFIIFLKSFFKNTIAIYGILFLLITPMLYWSGKLASPDILAASIGFLGVYLYFFSKKIKFSMIIFTIALSIKISLLPIVLVVFLYDISVKYNKNKIEWIKPIITDWIIVVIVFFLLNLYFFTNTKDYIDTLIFYSNNHKNHIANFIELLSSIDIRLFRLGGSSWDLVFFGSLFYWSTQPIVLFIFFIISIKYSKNKFIHVVFFLFFFISFLFILRQSDYGWNWFPFIMIFSLIFLNLKNSKSMHFISIFFIIIGVFYSYENIILEIDNKKSQIENINDYRTNKSEINICIEDFLQNNKLKVGRTINYSEIQVGINNSSFLYSFWRIKNKYIPNDMILIGNRTNKNLPYLKEKVMSYSYKETNCNFITIYFITGEKQ